MWWNLMRTMILCTLYGQYCLHPFLPQLLHIRTIPQIGSNQNILINVWIDQMLKITTLKNSNFPINFLHSPAAWIQWFSLLHIEFSDRHSLLTHLHVMLFLLIVAVMKFFYSSMKLKGVCEHAELLPLAPFAYFQHLFRTLPTRLFFTHTYEILLIFICMPGD